MQTQNNFIKIPNNISLIYCKKKKIIIFSGPIRKKILKLKLKLIIFNSKKVITVSLIPFFNISNTERKKLKSLKGTTISNIKQLIIETSITLYQKLKLVGVGYKLLLIDMFKDNLIQFKLGLSHKTFFGINKKVNFFCKKQTQLFIIGNSYQNITQIASFIRTLKKPEPYKGKGILYANEIINLKKGKKI